MSTEHLNPVSIVIMIVFIIMAAVAVGAVVTAIVHMIGAIIPQSAQESLKETYDDWRRSLRSIWRRLRRVEDDADRDADGSDLNVQAMQLLAMMPMLAVLTDEDGHVTRANPRAYQLGIVNTNDDIASPEVARAIQHVAQSGGNITVHVVTQTPKQTVTTAEQSTESQQSATTPKQDITQLNAQPSADTQYAGASPTGASDALDSEDIDSDAVDSEVTRRNWLTITVGALDDDLVACLIRDDSEQHRFARIQQDFVTHVAARLLEPMRNLERLGDDLSQEDADIDQVMASAGKVHEYASTTAHILADLLLLIRAQSPVDKAHGDIVDMAVIAQSAVAQHTAMSHNAGVPVRIRMADNLRVRGDSEQLQAAIARLVANAIIYSPTGAVVDVIGDTVVHTSEHGISEHMVRIRVIDRGVGIDPADIDHIFQRFKRGHIQPQWPNRNDIEHGGAAQGIGLGLAIVKHVALAHEGTAVAWSRKGAGSTFTFTLPGLD